MNVEMTVENVTLRHDAVGLARRHFWRLLGMTLLALLIMLSVDLVATAVGDAITAKETQALTDALRTVAESNIIISDQSVRDAARALLTSPGFVVFNLVYALISALLLIGLTLGVKAQYLGTVRGGFPRIRGVFGRMRVCLKGLGLNVLIKLKLLAWAIPGLTIMLWGGDMAANGFIGASGFLMLFGMGLMLGLVIPAWLRYALVTHCLADDPKRGVRECVALSKRLMKGRKWQYFRFCALILLKLLGALYGTMLLGALVMIPFMRNTEAVLIARCLSIVMCLAMGAGGLYFLFQLEIASTLYYVKRYQPVADAPLSYWLRDESSTKPVSAWLDAPSTGPPAEAIAASTEQGSTEDNNEKELIK